MADPSRTMDPETETTLTIGLINEADFERPTNITCEETPGPRPLFEIDPSGHEQPVDEPGVLSQSLPTASFGERFAIELVNGYYWFLVGMSAVAGFLLWVGHNVLAVIFLIVSHNIYASHRDRQSQKNIETFVRKITSDRDKEMKFVRQVNAIQRLTTQSGYDDGDTRSQWINDLIDCLWPYANGLVQKFIDSHGFSSKGIHQGNRTIFIERFSMGDKPPVITHFNVNKLSTRPDEIVLDIRLFYLGNCLVSVSKKPSLITLPVGVKDVYFQSNCRLTIRPLMWTAPFVGGFAFSLLDTPTIDFDGFNIGGLADNFLIRTAVKKAINLMAVEPNRFYFLLVHDLKIKRMLMNPKPVAMVVFQILEAQDLPKMTIAKISHDPFCLVRVGGVYFQTEVINRDSNPRWKGEVRWCPVHDYSDDFKVQLYDSDMFTPDDLIGSVEFKVSNIRDPSVNGLDKWIQITGSTTGALHLKVACFPLTTNREKLIVTMDKLDKCLFKFPFGMISVFIHSIRPAMALDEVHDGNFVAPFLLLKCGGETFTTEPSKPGEFTKKIDQFCSFRCQDPRCDIFQVIAINKYQLKSQDATKQPLKADQVLSYKAFEVKQLISREDMTFDGEITLDGNLTYVVNICLHFMVCDVPDDTLVNLQQNFIGHNDISNL